MLIIRDVPLVPLQEQIFAVLKAGQDHAVYGGALPLNAETPCITFGNVTAKPIMVKNESMWNCTVTIDAWADTDEKQIVNEMVNDISTLITAKGPIMQLEAYHVVAVDIELVEAFPSDQYGYHGTVTAVFVLQQK